MYLKINWREIYGRKANRTKQKEIFNTSVYLYGEFWYILLYIVLQVML